eukprot:CAMPEP_0206039240 /NCGR_PEP_ID=MMETSP1466-20131121/4625_1 /ASSEMBLY_ACC=CAM_ASM_001126 /TAXON_ID=44452 /ORGANISM="Pavlova gyrans, Strain CCMP608" /LENGTH=149 /DNA_ID=CAMNT_0053413873 /DNA_START=23 /DNA_END=472 /DNA_ORIENTATION=-
MMLAVGATAALGVPATRTALSARPSARRSAFMSDALPDWTQVDATDANERIEKMIQDNKIMVFMKGSKLMPQCGFSNAVVQVFKSMSVPFETFDVLSDPAIRQGIKEYSNWPTIPQVYVEGEFIGGCDIVVDMYQKGELQEMVERAAAE